MINGAKLHSFFITFKQPLCRDLSQLVLHFYDRENRGANQDVVYRIYFGLFVDWLTTSRSEGFGAFQKLAILVRQN